MRLRELSEEHLSYLHVLFARGYSVPSALRAFARRWPDAHLYDASTVRDYLETDEARERTSAVLTQIRERAADYAFADKGSRIDLLNERAQSIANQLRELERYDERDITASKADPKEVSQLNSELRQTLAAIQKEMDPLSAAETLILSPAQALIDQLTRNGLTPSDVRGAMERDEVEN